MKQAILELTDRKIEKLIPTSSFGTSIIDSSKIDVLQELRQEIEAMDEPLIPEIDNLYEFSEGGEVWVAGRLMRYRYRSKEGGILSARYIRSIPPNN